MGLHAVSHRRRYHLGRQVTDHVDPVALATPVEVGHELLALGLVVLLEFIKHIDDCIPIFIDLIALPWIGQQNLSSFPSDSLKASTKLAFQGIYQAMTESG